MSISGTETTAAAATPILASSLLAGSSSTPCSSAAAGSQKGWDLKGDILDDGDSDLLEVGGKGVLGISGLKDNDADVGELALWMLVRFLASARSNSSGVDDIKMPARRASIIHPAHSTIFSPERMLSGLLSIIGKEVGNDTLTHHLLSRTEILRVFDFEQMMQAVSAVSERVYSERKEGGRDAGAGGEVMVIIEGVDRFTKSVIEKSDTVRGNALLNVLLRRLGVLARGDGNGNGNGERERVRVLVVNGGIGVGGIGAGADSGSGGEKREPIVPATMDDAKESEEASTEPSLHSEKPPNSDQQLKYQRQNRHPSSIFLYNHVNFARPWGFYLAFSKSLDQGIDTHLLVSRIQGQRVVEVAKDRVEDEVGRWCVSR